MSLLDKAKSATTNSGRKASNFSQEEIELALAWTKDEVHLFQVQKALKFKNTAHAYVWLARCLRYYIQLGGKI